MSIDAPSDSTGNAPDQMGIRRMGRYLLPLLFLGLAVHLIPPQIASLEHSVQVLRTLALWAVGLAVMAQAVSYAGSGYLLQATVALAQGSVSILKSLMITLASASIGLVAGAATFRWLRKGSTQTQPGWRGPGRPFSTKGCCRWQPVYLSSVPLPDDEPRFPYEVLFITQTELPPT